MLWCVGKTNSDLQPLLLQPTCCFGNSWNSWSTCIVKWLSSQPCHTIVWGYASGATDCQALHQWNEPHNAETCNLKSWRAWWLVLSDPAYCCHSTEAKQYCKVWQYSCRIVATIHVQLNICQSIPERCGFMTKVYHFVTTQQYCRVVCTATLKLASERPYVCQDPHCYKHGWCWNLPQDGPPCSLESWHYWWHESSAPACQRMPAHRARRTLPHLAQKAHRYTGHPSHLVPAIKEVVHFWLDVWSCTSILNPFLNLLCRKAVRCYNKICLVLVQDTMLVFMSDSTSLYWVPNYLVPATKMMVHLWPNVWHVRYQK